jgi:hypothetical protein
MHDCHMNIKKEKLLERKDEHKILYHEQLTDPLRNANAEELS